MSLDAKKSDIKGAMSGSSMGVAHGVGGVHGLAASQFHKGEPLGKEIKAINETTGRSIGGKKGK